MSFAQEMAKIAEEKAEEVKEEIADAIDEAVEDKKEEVSEEPKEEIVEKEDKLDEPEGTEVEITTVSKDEDEDAKELENIRRNIERSLGRV